jgi:hypothetical protein
MGAYGEEMESMAGGLESLSQQMTQALASGNKAVASSLAGQMSAAMTRSQQQLASSMQSLVSGYASALAQMEADIQAAMP